MIVKNKSDRWRRLLAILAALVVGVTFTPMLGGSVNAAEKSAPDVTMVTVDGDGAEIDVEEGDVPEMVDPANQETALKDVTVSQQAVKSAEAVPDTGGLLMAAQEEGGVSIEEASVCDITAGVLTGTSYTLKCNIKSGYENTYKFGAVVIDGIKEKVSDTGATRLDEVIDMSDCDTGFHTLQVIVKKDGAIDANQTLYHRYLGINQITKRPNYKGTFSFFHNFFNFYPYSFQGNQDDTLFIEYSGDKGKNWGRAHVPSYNEAKLPTDQGYSIGNLMPNTKYKTRFCYGANVVYEKSIGGDGLTYYFNGPALDAGSYKTGMAKKPKVKSVKVQAIKVKKRKDKVTKKKYWTYQLKVTVKLKKKPGTKGIYLSVDNGKGTATYFLKGNKTKYTKKFAIYPGYSYKKPPKGLKVKVSIRSMQNKNYGGYSPQFKKKYKVKK